MAVRPVFLPPFEKETLDKLKLFSNWRVAGTRQYYSTVLPYTHTTYKPDGSVAKTEWRLDKTCYRILLGIVQQVGSSEYRYVSYGSPEALATFWDYNRISGKENSMYAAKRQVERGWIDES